MYINEFFNVWYAYHTRSKVLGLSACPRQGQGGFILGTLHTLGVTQGKAPAKQKEKGKHL
jgi:hypothetical protein